MGSASDSEKELMRRAVTDASVLNDLFALHRQRLSEMLRLRINPQLQSRIDESDIIQEVMVDATRNFQQYARAPRLSFYLWLRHLASLKLTEAHRRHLGAQKRDAYQEISLEDIRPQDASAASMAAELVGNSDKPIDEVMRRESLDRIREALEGMDPVDREVLALRHFEQLSVSETAQELGLSKAGAGSRYLRALKRLRDALAEFGGLDDLALGS